MKKLSKRGCLILGAGALALLIAATLCWDLLDQAPRRRLKRLLRGGDVDVRSLVITGQRRTIELNDPESTEYLARAFRSAVREGYVPEHNPGLSYECSLRLGSTGSVLVSLDVPDDVDGLTIGYPLDCFEDPIYYWVPLPQPMPAPVAAAIEQMRQPPRGHAEENR